MAVSKDLSFPARQDVLSSLTQVVDDFAAEALMAISECEADDRSVGRSRKLFNRFAAMWRETTLAHRDLGAAPRPAVHVLAAMARMAADPQRDQLSIDAAVATIDGNAPGWDPSWRMSDVRTDFERRYGQFERPLPADWMKFALGGLARVNIMLEAAESGTRLSEPQQKLFDELVDHGRRSIDGIRLVDAAHDRLANANGRHITAFATASSSTAATVLLGVAAATSGLSWAWAPPAALAAITALGAQVSRVTGHGLDAARKALVGSQRDVRAEHERMGERLVNAEPPSKDDLKKLADRSCNRFGIPAEPARVKR